MKSLTKTKLIFTALILTIVFILTHNYIEQSREEKLFLNHACGNLKQISMQIDEVLEYENAEDLQTTTLLLYSQILEFNALNENGYRFVSNEIPTSSDSDFDIIPKALLGWLSGNEHQKEPFWQDGSLSEGETAFLNQFKTDLDNMQLQISDDYGVENADLNIKQYWEVYHEFAANWYQDDFRNESGISYFDYLKIE